MRLPVSLSALLVVAALSACTQDDPVTALPVPPASATTASASPEPLATTSPAPTPTAPPARLPAVRLTGNGVDLPTQLVEFGTSYLDARPALDRFLGTPTNDPGPGPSFSDYGTCPGTMLQPLEYGQGALVLLFGDVDGPALTLYGWRLTGEGSTELVPRASALVGDAATFEFGVDSSVAELQEGAPGMVALDPGDELAAASFRLTDQSLGFSGQLTGTAPADTVAEVGAGKACGE